MKLPSWKFTLRVGRCSMSRQISLGWRGFFVIFLGFAICYRCGSAVAGNVSDQTKLTILNDLVLRTLKASVLALGLIRPTYHAVEFLYVGLVLKILYSFSIGDAPTPYFKRKISISFQQITCMFFLLFELLKMIYEEGVSIDTYGLVISFASGLSIRPVAFYRRVDRFLWNIVICSYFWDFKRY